jgi:hypothetical protein
MRGLFVVLALLVATPAVAEDFAAHFEGRHQHRAFWLNNTQGWPMTQPDSANNPAPKPKFTKTYIDGVASRFTLGSGGHFDLFERKFAAGYGVPAPAIVGTFDHGAAMLEMRWHPGE